MRDVIRKRNFYIMLFLDACLVVAAYLLAYLLRFEGDIPQQEWQKFIASIPYILLFKLLIFVGFGLYKGLWRYTSFVDLINVLKATVTSSVGVILGILFVYRFVGFPRSIFILDWILAFIFIAGIRVAIRLILAEKERSLQFLFQNPFAGRKVARPKKNLLIIGAGDVGEKILREIRDNPRLDYEVVGFLDDDSKKRGMRIHGVSVLGPVERIHGMAYPGLWFGRLTIPRTIPSEVEGQTGESNGLI